MKNYIYVSSRVKFANMWTQYRTRYPLIRATWITTPPPQTPDDWKRLWDACLLESSACGALVLYAPDEEILKGGLVEVGSALSHNTPVFYTGLVGRLPMGGLLNNPYIIQCPTLENALDDATQYIALRNRTP